MTKPRIIYVTTFYSQSDAGFQTVSTDFKAAIIYVNTTAISRSIQNNAEVGKLGDFTFKAKMINEPEPRNP
jgi:hypothetical protein